jgi:vacuolar-type H+-ATPase subunit I/STV1
VIVRMLRVRIAGPRSLLDRTLTVLQDLGVLHVDRPSVQDDRTPDRAVIRERRHIEQCLSDVETARATAAAGRRESNCRGAAVTIAGCPPSAAGNAAAPRR